MSDANRRGPRLGELLVAARILAVDQVEAALRAQVMWGGRIGTNLIELGCLDLDGLSRALGRQHRLPAALARHFDVADPNLQGRMTADVAEKFSCVPLVRAQHNIVIAATGPLDARALAIIGDELGVGGNEIVVSVAAELRIRYHLERVFKIPRTTRFLRSRGKTVPPFPFQILPVTVDPGDDVELQLGDHPPDPARTDRELGGRVDTDRDEAAVTGAFRAQTDPGAVRATTEQDAVRPVIESPGFAGARSDAERRGDPIDDGVITEDLDDLTSQAIPMAELSRPLPAPEPAEEAVGRDRRKYVRTIADAPSPDSERALARIKVRRLPTEPHGGAAEERPPGSPSSLNESIRAIRRGNSREDVAELVLETIRSFVEACDAAMLMVVRGDVAIGWKGFARSGHTPPELAVPMEQPGLVPSTVSRNVTVRCSCDDLEALDQLLFRALGGVEGDLVIVPVPIAGQVMCVIATATESDASVTSLETIATAAGAAFARLMRAASR
jgi:MshEN domain